MDTRSAGGHQVGWVLLFVPWMHLNPADRDQPLENPG